MTTDLRALLDQLDQAREKATTGEWRVAYPFTKLVDLPGRPAAVTAETAADAALIVAAVNALPALVAAVRAVADLTDELAVEAVRDADSANPYTQGTSDAKAISADRLRAALAPLTAGDQA